MGFGILFFGYFAAFALSLANVYFFADIVGTLIILWAFFKLAQYNRYYHWAIAAAFLFLAACAANASSMLFSLYDGEGWLGITVTWVKNGASCMMHVMTFLGIRGIAGGASSEKLVKMSVRSLVATLIYFAAAVGVFVYLTVTASESQYLSLGVYFSRIIVIAMNLWLFYKCFAILVPADEDETAPRRSRFAFINRIDDKMDEFAKNRQRYQEEAVRSAQESARKRAEKKAAKKKKK